jgi:hypothetical protein
MVAGASFQLPRYIEPVEHTRADPSFRRERRLRLRLLELRRVELDLFGEQQILLEHAIDRGERSDDLLW